MIVVIVCVWRVRLELIWLVGHVGYHHAFRLKPRNSFAAETFFGISLPDWLCIALRVVFNRLTITGLCFMATSRH